MVNAELTAQRLLEYYEGNRCVGHTRSAMDGVTTSDGARILTANQAHAEQLQSIYELPRGTTVTLHRLTNMGMQSTTGPLVLDHFAVETLVHDLLSTITFERRKAVDLERKMDKIKWILNE